MAKQVRKWKVRKYLHCVVTKHNGETYINELKLSEARLVGQLAQDNAKVEVTVREASEALYKSIFIN